MTAYMTARDEARTVTQTITRESTTIITLVTLGNGQPTDYSGHRINPGADIYAHGPDHLTGAQLGGIIGSAVAFAVILLSVWYCMLRARQRVEAMAYDDYMMESSSWMSSGRDDGVEEQQSRR